MSLAGLKKQLNKANQFVSEKIGGAKGTELDSEFKDMENKIDATTRLLDEMVTNVQEYLQPNAAYRAKMLATSQLSIISGAPSKRSYPQPETTIGEGMISKARELAPSTYSNALEMTGNSFKQLAESKYSLEDNIKQRFFDPINQTKRELNEIAYHRKKLEGRRLDFDCKKRKKVTGGATDEEIGAAEQKFVESRASADASMNNMLDSEAERIAQLSGLVEAMLIYHQESVDALKKLQQDLERSREEAVSKPRSQRSVNPYSRTGDSDSGLTTPLDPWAQRDLSNGGGGGASSTPTPRATSPRPVSPRPPAAAPGPIMKPSAKALFDFVAENAGELSFKENDMIELVDQLDENWFMGKVNGQQGHFPINYVTVLVPLKKK